MIITNSFLVTIVGTNDEIVCAVCIGIIFICIFIFSFYMIKLFDQENKIANSAKQREKINKIRKRK